MSDPDSAGGSSNFVGRVAVLLFVVLAAWIIAGTEWSLLFDKGGFVRGLGVENAAPSGEGRCEATLDIGRLPQRPTRVSVRRAAGDEVLDLSDGRATLEYARGGTAVEVRLTFIGILHKPSHADITLVQQGCQLQPAGFQSMPLLPF